MNDLNNKVVVVTGAGSGIGKGIAAHFAEKGCRVVLATLDNREGQQVERELLDKGYTVRFVQTDVRDQESVIAMFEQAKIVFGTVQVLINNAGITVFKPLLEATLEDWNRVIDTDLRGVFLCAKYMAQNLIKERLPGTIINISSNHAFRTLPDTEMYAAAKGGVNAMTRSMALSLGQFGIRVNCVCPGFTKTSHYDTWLIKQESPSEVHQDVINLHATGRISTPDDIAKMVLFLASSASGNITGADFLVDGGMTNKLYHSQKF